MKKETLTKLTEKKKEWQEPVLKEIGLVSETTKSAQVGSVIDGTEFPGGDVRHRNS